MAFKAGAVMKLKEGAVIFLLKQGTTQTGEVVWDYFYIPLDVLVSGWNFISWDTENGLSYRGKFI